MKVKNIMFSGFAAAIFAGACGAADAAAVSLISKDYADTKLQAKLTAGDNIVIDENNTIKADGLATSTELAGVKATADAAAVETEVNAALDLKANAADVYSKTEVYNKTEVDKKVADIVSGDMSAALEAYVTTETYDAGMALKADKTAVEAITTSLNDYKTEVSNTYATKTALAEVSAVADAAQTAAEVSASISGALADYTTTTDMNAALDLKADKTQVATDIKAVRDVMATDAEVEAAITALNLADTYEAKGEAAKVNTALTEYKTSNDAAVLALQNKDTELAGDISDNAAAIATNKTATETNASAIEALQNAGYFAGIKTAGSYLVNFDASGNATYAAVEILDGNGSAIDLTTNAVK